ncbi:MAG: hypothetical protein RMJ84_04135 [Sandaracinaceae bacterium]|nr:hypothetical protein [Sandaracinaceae bacterium]
MSREIQIAVELHLFDASEKAQARSKALYQVLSSAGVEVLCGNWDSASAQGGDIALAILPSEMKLSQIRGVFELSSKGVLVIGGQNDASSLSEVEEWLPWEASNDQVLEALLRLCDRLKAHRSTASLGEEARAAPPLSETLFDLFLETDRRLFPHEARIDLTDLGLPGSQIPASKLVPEDFIESFGASLSEKDEFDLGLLPRLARAEPVSHEKEGALPSDPRPSSLPSVALAGPSLGGSAASSAFSVSARVGSPDSSTAQRLSKIEKESTEKVLSRTPSPPRTPGRTSSENALEESFENLGPFGAFALLGQAAMAGMSARFGLTLPSGALLSLVLHDGELVEITGEGFASLRHERWAMERNSVPDASESPPEIPSNWREAVLLERIESLALASGIAQAKRLSRQLFRRGENSPKKRRFPRSFLPWLFEWAPVALPFREVLALRFGLEGKEAPARLLFEPKDKLEKILDAVEAPCAFRWLVRERLNRSPSGGWLVEVEASGERGLLSQILALVELGGLSLRILPEALASPTSLSELKRLVAIWTTRIERGDYFAILNVSKEDPPELIASAYAHLRASILAWPLERSGLRHLEGERARILDAIDEAARVLTNPRLRLKYIEGLKAAFPVAF